MLKLADTVPELPDSVILEKFITRDDRSVFSRKVKILSYGPSMLTVNAKAFAVALDPTCDPEEVAPVDCVTDVTRTLLSLPICSKLAIRLL